MVAAPPDNVPRPCDVPSPKLMVTSRRALLPVAFATSNVTVTLFVASLAGTAAQVPLATGDVHFKVTAGAARNVTVAVAVAVPADAVTFVSAAVVSVVVA